jgi:nicotinate phosphoribosyltransferase
VTQATSLLTDRYELTMLDAALKAGTHDRECVFECFARRLPTGRRFGVVAGTGRLLELIRDFRFGDAELEYLRSEHVVGEDALAWLADYRFRGRITGYREGEVYFPGSPLLTVEAPFADGVILETLVLSVLNYDSAVASAAARMVQVAGGRPLAEMGSRRTGERSAVAAARAAFIAGFSATSNLEAGRTWGVPTMGTAAHSFTLLHDTEEQAFRAQVDALGAGTTLLVDTYDVRQGVETAVRVAGTGLGAVRLDSGDLPVLVGEVRAQLDALGATGTRITVTNDLDEHGIAGLAVSPVDSYGVGTSLVTGSGAPAAGMVFKLVAHRDADGGEWVPVAKRSTGKQSRGGLKGALRRHDASGVATSELVTVGPHPDPHPGDRDLVVTLAEGGEPDRRWLGAEGTAAARAHHARVVRDLPLQAFRLRAGDPAIPTEDGTAA